MQLPNAVFKMKRLVTLKADDNPLTIAIPPKFAPRKSIAIADDAEEEEMVEVDINTLPIDERLRYVGKVGLYTISNVFGLMVFSTASFVQTAVLLADWLECLASDR